MTFKLKKQQKTLKQKYSYVFERTRTFTTGIINIHLEHGTFFKLPLFEEVPRNF